MEFLTFQDKNEAASKAGEYLNSLLEREFGAPVLLLLAGGSSLSILDAVQSQFLGAHITIAVSDERFSGNPAINNFEQIKTKRFYANAQARGCLFIATHPLSGETLEAFGVRFNNALQAWRVANPNGVIIMTQGIGSDGHTAGIMPYPEDTARFGKMFEDSSIWAIGYDATGKNEHTLRVTITLPFLIKEVQESVVFAVGSDKRSALKRAWSEEGSLAETPARIIREMKSVKVFTDQKI